MRLYLQPPLIQSIFAGDVEEIKLLLGQHQEDVNAQGNKYLLRKKYYKKKCLFVDAEKRTALHAAAFKGDSTIAAILLAHGARVNAKDNKWYTPLHRACCTGSEVS